jgi:hypothetical protein
MTAARRDSASATIAHRRLAAQLLSATTCTRPEDVVAHFGAMQAQDYLGALWAIGVRMTAAVEADIERALAERRIVRTWPMRGTMHFVAAADARWMLALLAPKAVTGAARRLRELGLDAKQLGRARTALVAALAGGKQLARDDVYRVLERAKVATANSRGLHVLWWLAHHGVICFGPRAGKQQTFVLLDEWVPATPALDRDAALGELARRYFRGHGPATLSDFCWWSSLKQSDARRAIELAGTELDAETIDGERYWSVPVATARTTPALVLPAFDELLVGYTDRSALLAPAQTKRVNAGGGILKPTIVIDGRVVGTWQRRFERGGVRFERAPFGKLDRTKLAAAEARYLRFLGA